jgi:hypothetical protein
LKSLQTELLASVEVQVDKRRKEVEYWMELCVGIEHQCVRYTKALGGNIKATDSSIGELRKEQALPRRHDLISEYQEKLRQVFYLFSQRHLKVDTDLPGLPHEIRTTQCVNKSAEYHCEDAGR